jgi:hypothetical protein
MPRILLSIGGRAIAVCLVFAGCSATLDDELAPSALRIRLPDATIPDGVAVSLPIAAFKAGFGMCSRPGPSSVTSYWEVSQDDVQRVDQELLTYLRNASSKNTIAYRPEKFVRQYAGFRRGTHPFIYVNAFPSDELAHSDTDPSKTFLGACDGGDLFWGIEYDVGSGTFARLETNGSPIVH